MHLTTVVRKLDASEHPIKSVTIFQSARAEVVREFSIDLQAGENVIDIVNLPSCIETDSVRVQGLGSAILSDVICTPPPVKTGNVATTPKKSAVLEELEYQRAILLAKQDVQNSQAELLAAYAKTVNSEHVPPSVIAEFLSTYGTVGKANVEASFDITKQLKDLDRAIKEETDNPTVPPETSHLTEFKVRVVIYSEEGSAAQLSLVYAVTNVKWSPLFDLRAKTVDGKPSKSMSLHYRAAISQNTGEDWADVANLTLSTAAPHYMTSIPSLGLFKIRPLVPSAPPIPMQMMQQMPVAAAAPPRSMHDSNRRRGGGPPSGHPLPPLATTTTTVSDSGISATFKVKGNATIPSDTLSHNVAIAALQVESEIYHITVPKVTPVAYLQCTIKNTSEYHLLAGPLSVYLDDGYISKTMLNRVAPQDTFSCSLGPDPSVRVSFKNGVKRLDSVGSAFSVKSDRIQYDHRISLINKRQTPVEKIVVKDGVPVSDDSAVKVILHTPAGLAEASSTQEIDVAGATGVKARWGKIVEGKGGIEEGKMEWIVQLDGREEKELELVWEVTSPAGTQWQYANA